MSSNLKPIETFNILDRNEFMECVHILFEPAPLLSEKLFASRPFVSYEQLIDVAEKLIHDMNESDRILVINAHPRIGAAKETLSSQSYQEQGYSKPFQSQNSNENQHLEKKLTELNEEYEKKYGFKFVVFVNGRSRQEIVPVFEKRLHQSNREDELITGLTDMMAIARDRLRKIQLVK